MLSPAMPTISGFFEMVKPMAGRPKNRMNSVTIIGTPRSVSTYARSNQCTGRYHAPGLASRAMLINSPISIESAIELQVMNSVTQTPASNAGAQVRMSARYCEMAGDKIVWPVRQVLLGFGTHEIRLCRRPHADLLQLLLLHP